MKDKRTQKTLKLIRSTFVDIAHKKDISQITVKEICEQANINRSTFYTYYKDYPDFLEKTETEVANDFLSIIKHYDFDTDTTPVVEMIIQYISDNLDDFFLLFANETKDIIWKKLSDSIKEITLPVWVKESSLSHEQAEWVFIYFIYGLYGFLQHYYRNPNLDKKMLKEILDNIIREGIYHYIYTK